MDIGQLLEDSGAILRGHFVLTSGRHSDTYFEKFRILERPDVLSALCKKIADHFADDHINVVTGPTTGGIIVAFEVARHLGVRALYVESEGGAKKLRRGATIGPGSRVLLVDDVLTTGLSLLEVETLLKSQGATISGAGVLISRAEQPPAVSVPIFAAFTVQAKSYAPDAVPEWLAELPVQKPGTRV